MGHFGKLYGVVAGRLAHGLNKPAPLFQGHLAELPLGGNRLGYRLVNGIEYPVVPAGSAGGPRLSKLCRNLSCDFLYFFPCHFLYPFQIPANFGISITLKTLKQLQSVQKI
jgi:hypothetical protein